MRDTSGFLRQAVLSHMGVMALFSAALNVLMLVGPLFMLQVYDRVLTGRSEATLIALFGLVAALYLAMGILDFVRSRIGARLGASLQARIDAEAFSAALRSPPSASGEGGTALADVEAIRRLFAAPAFFAVFDLPFTPLFMAFIFLLSPWLGVLALASAAILVLLMGLNQVANRRLGTAAAQASAASTRLAELMRTQPETIHGLGMGPAAIARWQVLRNQALAVEMALADRTGAFGVASKTTRLFLQSAMLAMGAWLVLQNQLTGGAMITGSILLGRALAPIEQVISGWPTLTRATAGAGALRRLFQASPPRTAITPLGKPRATLHVENVTIIPPGHSRPILRNLSFQIEGGQAIAIVGESAVGKSSLARVLAGWWKPVEGSVRLDGAALDQFDEETLASHVGYLPQEVVFFDGTVAENIARLKGGAAPEKIVQAARMAGAHEMILRLPQGYDTDLRSGMVRLSGGQKQRLGLARALFGDPVVVVLDEPNANLDALGSELANEAVRQMKSAGKAVIIIAHRPSAIAECDTVLMLRAGGVAALGPRDEVLRQNVVQKPAITAVLPQRAAR